MIFSIIYLLRKMYGVMTEILCNAADKEVLRALSGPGFTNSFAWREKSEPVDICPGRFSPAVGEENPVF